MKFVQFVINYIRECYIGVELAVCLWWSASLSCY